MSDAGGMGDDSRQDEHLSESVLFGWLVDGQTLVDGAAAHLAACAQCQATVAQTRRLLDDMAVYRASVPSDDARARYASLFRQVRADKPRLLNRLASWLTGDLVFDSRTQALAAGVRSGGHSAYRQVFRAGAMELELFVEPENGRRTLMGEVLGAADSVYLVQLTALGGESSTWEQETDDSRAFRFEALRPGRYRLDVVGGVVALSIAELALE